MVGRGCDSDRYQAGPHLHDLVLDGENFHDVPVRVDGISVSTLSVATSAGFISVDVVADGDEPTADGGFGDVFAKEEA